MFKKSRAYNFVLVFYVAVATACSDVLLACRPVDCTAPAGHSGSGPQAPASPGCGRQAGSPVRLPGLACSPSIDTGTAQPRRTRRLRAANAGLSGQWPAHWCNCLVGRASRLQTRWTARRRRDIAVLGRKRRLPRAVAGRQARWCGSSRLRTPRPILTVHISLESSCQWPSADTRIIIYLENEISYEMFKKSRAYKFIKT